MGKRLCYVPFFATAELRSNQGSEVIGPEAAHNFNQCGNKEVLEIAEEGVK